jgi:hypothetical protein
VLLAVISICNITSDNRTGRGASDFQKVLVFPEYELKMPSGTGKRRQNWGYQEGCTRDAPDNENKRDHIRELLLEKELPPSLAFIWVGKRINR